MNWPEDFINKIICGDNLSVMKEMPDESVNMVLTSPPYWGLRDYGLGPEQLGLELTPELYIENLTEIFNEAKRVLKKEGTLWLNIADTYGGDSPVRKSGSEQSDPKKQSVLKRSAGGTRRGASEKEIGIRPKCLCMIPERLAWSLIQNGWILRNKIPWVKPSSMRFSGKDRFANTWEYVFYFVKSRKNYFNLDAVLKPYTKPLNRWGGPKIGIPKKTKWKGDSKAKWAMSNRERLSRPNPAGKNPGDVFVVNAESYQGDHFAVFPEKLCEIPIKAGCPKNGILLDPFAGTGTALFVAKELRRRFIGIDIKKEYCELAKKRLAQGVL